MCMCDVIEKSSHEVEPEWHCAIARGALAQLSRHELRRHFEAEASRNASMQAVFLKPSY